METIKTMKENPKIWRAPLFAAGYLLAVGGVVWSVYGGFSLAGSYIVAVSGVLGGVAIMTFAFRAE